MAESIEFKNMKLIKALKTLCDTINGNASSAKTEAINAKNAANAAKASADAAKNAAGDATNAYNAVVNGVYLGPLNKFSFVECTNKTSNTVLVNVTGKGVCRCEMISSNTSTNLQINVDGTVFTTPKGKRVDFEVAFQKSILVKAISSGENISARSTARFV